MLVVTIKNDVLQQLAKKHSLSHYGSALRMELEQMLSRTIKHVLQLPSYTPGFRCYAIYGFDEFSDNEILVMTLALAADIRKSQYN